MFIFIIMVWMSCYYLLYKGELDCDKIIYVI